MESGLCLRHAGDGGGGRAVLAVSSSTKRKRGEPGRFRQVFTGVIFNAQGLYSFSLDIDGQDPIVSTFNVQLAMPQINQTAMLGGGFQR